MRIVLFGGASELGLAIVHELLAGQAGLARAEVVLAGRPNSVNRATAIASVEQTGAAVQWLEFDAADVDSHAAVVEAAFAAPVDVAIVAFGVLGARETWRDHADTLRLARANYLGALSIGVLLGQRFTAQGQGKLIAISSMAGERVRRANLVYGSTKAGMDGFYLQLGVELAAEGIQVLVVRPGTVIGRMTAGRQRVPLSTTPEKVAKATVRALNAGRALVRVPAVFNVISAVYRNLPAWLVNRMPF